VPVLPNPFREPLAGGLELLACCTPFDTRHALSIWHPAELASQTGEAPLHAGVKAAEPQEAGLL
jgi:hypothetical protein